MPPKNRDAAAAARGIDDDDEGGDDRLPAPPHGMLELWVQASKTPPKDRQMGLICALFAGARRPADDDDVAHDSKCIYVPSGLGGTSKIDKNELSALIKAAINEDDTIMGNDLLMDVAKNGHLTSLWYEPDVDGDGAGGDGEAVMVPLSQVAAHPTMWCSHPNPGSFLEHNDGDGAGHAARDGPIVRVVPGDEDGQLQRVYYVVNPDVDEDEDTEGELDLWSGYVHSLLLLTLGLHVAAWFEYGFLSSLAVPAASLATFLLVQARTKGLKLRNGKDLNGKLWDELFFIPEKFHEEALPWVISAGFAVAYGSLLGILNGAVGSVSTVLRVSAAALIRPAYRTHMGLPLASGQAFDAALPKVCEAVTRQPAGFWAANPVACAAIVTAFEDSFIDSALRGLAFVAIFLGGCWVAYEFIIAKLFDGVNSVVPHLVVYGAVALAAWQVYSNMPASLL